MNHNVICILLAFGLYGERKQFLELYDNTLNLNAENIYDPDDYECPQDVAFFIETKGKNEVDGKKVPFWRFWYTGGDEDWFFTEKPYINAILYAKQYKFF